MTKEEYDKIQSMFCAGYSFGLARHKVDTSQLGEEELKEDFYLYLAKYTDTVFNNQEKFQFMLDVMDGKFNDKEKV
jgi:hypothetical protein